MNEKIKIITLSFILIYFSLCMGLYFFQDSLLYFPIKSKTYNEKIFNKILFKSNVIGLESKIKKDKLVVIFHGNAGNANMRDYYIDFFGNDYQIIIGEYPGFGLSDSTLSKENIIFNAREIMKIVKVANYKEVIIAGESLGSGVASQMAKEFNINKLLLITPYSKISDVAQAKFSFFPIKLLLKDDYDSLKNLENYNGNLFLIIADKDQVIPKEFALSLFDKVSCEKDKIIVSNAGHNNWLDHLSEKDNKHIFNFIKK